MTFDEPAVTGVVTSVFENMLGVPAAFSADHAEPLDQVSVVACVQIGGTWNGAVVLEFTEPLAKRIAALMFGSPSNDATPAEICDAAGELANMIGGALKTRVPEPAQLSLPAVTQGANLRLSILGGAQVRRLEYACEGMVFDVRIEECAPGAAKAHASGARAAAHA
ncbi:MAG: chemotaxis protein CheX [Planctomycetota bacterium]|nr:chemotaxis protein CheX [Planctomycetota bacterium]